MVDLEKKQKFEFVGITEKEAQAVNDIRQQILKIISTQESNIKEINYALGQIDEDIEFLNKAKKEFKNPKYNNDYIARKTHVAEENKKYYMPTLRQSEEDLVNAKNFLELFDNKVDVETKVDENNEEVVIFSYDVDFYQTIIAFAKTIGLSQLL